MNISNDPLLKLRLEEDADRRHSQKLGGKLLAIGGIISAAGFTGLVIVNAVFHIIEKQADIVIGILSVIVSIFFATGLMFGIIGKEKH